MHLGPNDRPDPLDVGLQEGGQFDGRSLDIIDHWNVEVVPLATWSNEMVGNSQSEVDAHGSTFPDIREVAKEPFQSSSVGTLRSPNLIRIHLAHTA
jgi:hypothetical protein